VADRIQTLISGFDTYLAHYDERFPFTRAGQMSQHAATIERLRELDSDPVRAVQDEVYLASLLATLKAWGIGLRGSRLRPIAEVAAALLDQAELLSGLRHRTISEASLTSDGVDELVWQLIERVDIVDNEARLVALSKTLHHVLPDLVVPIDRTYTGRFFAWGTTAMQYKQRPLFFEAFTVFNQVAQAVDLLARVGSGWRSAPTKLIDNAIIAYCLTELEQATRSAPSGARRVGKYVPLGGVSFGPCG
jgi:hypothetical protein